MGLLLFVCEKGIFAAILEWRDFARFFPFWPSKGLSSTNLRTQCGHTYQYLCLSKGCRLVNTGPVRGCIIDFAWNMGLFNPYRLVCAAVSVLLAVGNAANPTSNNPPRAASLAGFVPSLRGHRLCAPLNRLFSTQLFWCRTSIAPHAPPRT